jgi:hypothetical protein
MSQGFGCLELTWFTYILYKLYKSRARTQETCIESVFLALHKFYIFKINMILF